MLVWTISRLAGELRRHDAQVTTRKFDYAIGLRGQNLANLQRQYRRRRPRILQIRAPSYMVFALLTPVWLQENKGLNVKYKDRSYIQLRANCTKRHVGQKFKTNSLISKAFIVKLYRGNGRDFINSFAFLCWCLMNAFIKTFEQRFITILHT